MSEQTSVERFPGRVGVIQPFVLAYREPLFDTLAARCDGGLSVLSGEPEVHEGHKSASNLKVAKHIRTRTRRFLPAPLTLYWQDGVGPWLRELNPDALIVASDPRAMSSRAALRTMKRMGKPVIGWGLGTMRLSSGFEGVRNMGRDRLIRSFDAMVAYGSRAADQYAQVRGSKDRVFTAFNSTMRRPTAPMPERPAGFRDGKPTVLFVGRINKEKRLDMLLRASAAMPEDRKPRLVIVGEGPSKAEDEALAREVYPSAEFRGGKFGAELDPIFAEADILVLPGLGGLAIQQAMSYGLPIISGEADGTQFDLVREGNGWIVPPKDLDALIAAMKEALGDAARLRRMGAESYRIVREEINIENMAATFVRALCAVTGRAPVVGPAPSGGAAAPAATARS